MDFDSEMERQEQFISEFCVAFEYFKNLVIIILYIFLLLFSDLFILPIFRTAHQNPAFRDGLHPQTSDTTPLTGGWIRLPEDAQQCRNRSAGMGAYAEVR